MKRIIVLGSTGMIGHEIVKLFNQNNYDVTEINTSGYSNPKSKSYKFDVLSDDIRLLGQVIREDDFVVNCIGLIKHLITESNIYHQINAIKINSVFPKQLSLLSKEINFRVIQPATDCVFSGLKGNYSEFDYADASDIYGRSKLIGETLDSNNLILRCSIIGRELHKHIEFMDWILTSNPDKPINGFTNHIWNGITSLHFAKIVKGIFDKNDTTSGTFHIVPRGTLSKFNLIELIVSTFELKNKKIHPVQASTSINRSLITHNTDYNTRIWNDAGHPVVPDIKEMLMEYKESLAK